MQYQPLPLHILHSYTPNPATCADSQPIGRLVIGQARHPSKVTHFIVALPTRSWAADVVGLRRTVRLRLVHEVPYQDLAIVRARGKLATTRRRPLDAIDGPSVATQFEQGLSWLSGIKYAYDIGVLCKRCEELGVVWGRRKP